MNVGIVGATGLVGGIMRTLLAEAGINIEMSSSSAIRISCIVREDAVEQAVQALHAAFDLA